MSDTIITAKIDSPEAAPLLAELDYEYTTRYEDYDGFDNDDEAESELEQYPPMLFEEPLGTLLLLQRDGETIAGGGFIYLDEETAEIKRVWTSSKHRRQGLSRKILGALEQAAVERGYRKIYLTTGPRQPEAVALYTSLGFTPLFDTEADPEEIAYLAFEKLLVADGGGLAVPSALEDRAAEQRDVIEASYGHRPRPETRLGK